MVERSNSSPRHPGIFVRWERSGRVNVCLSYCFSRSKRESNSRPPRFSPGRSPEVKRTFTTPEFLAAGISGPGVLPLLCQLSYSSLRRWRDLNPQPLVRCNPCLHHAATFQIFFLASLSPHFLLRGTPVSMYPRRPLRCVEFHAEKFREERMLTVFRESNPKPFGPFQTK
jgi:hypothetical protein